MKTTTTYTRKFRRERGWKIDMLNMTHGFCEKYVSLLMCVKAYHYNLRDRGHDLVLPMYRTLLFKKSYLTRHLFASV
jgi:hypothetical protein